MENPLIIEFFYATEELSTGLHVRMRPKIRLVYFEVDEDTGAKSVKDILEVDIQEHTNGPAYCTLHVIDWHNDFDHIIFTDQTEDGEGQWCEISRMDMTDNGTAIRIASYMMHMIWAHCVGYLDYEGGVFNPHTDQDLIKGLAPGEKLMDAYRKDDDGDHMPYLSAGTTAHIQMVRAN